MNLPEKQQARDVEWERATIRLRRWVNTNPHVHSGVINLDDPLAERSMLRFILDEVDA